MKHQRYVSDELTHFVGRNLKTNRKQFDLMCKILKEGLLSYPPNFPSFGNSNVRTTFGKDITASSNKMINPDMVCFCDIPIEDMSIHIKKYSPFGFSFSKEFILKKGGAPVFYIPKNAISPITDPLGKGHQTFSDIFDNRIKDHSTIETFIQQNGNININPVFLEYDRFLFFHFWGYLKFFDENLDDRDNNNFYLEREWRIINALSFSIDDVVRVFLKKEMVHKFKTIFPDFCGEITFTNKYT